MATLGTVIQDVREASGLTRAKLAKQAGISQVYVGKIEQGTRRPSATILARIADVLHVSATELMTRAALLDATDARTDDEFRRRLMRAAAMSSGTAVVGPLLGLVAGGPVGGLIGAALGTALNARLARLTAPATAEGSDQHEPKATAGSSRRALLALIDELSDDECDTAFLALTTQRDKPER